MAFCDNKDGIEELKSVPCAVSSEDRISFSLDYDGEVMRIEALPEGSTLTQIIDTDYHAIFPGQTGIVVEEGFARRHNIHAGDVITIGDVNVEVTDLAREYLYQVMYISYEQAASFGYSKSNAVAVLLGEDYTTDDFTKAASKINGYQFMTDSANRETYARETLKKLDMPCVLFICFAMVIGLVIICNMNLISIRERSREYATLLVLGTEKHRFLKMTATEAGIQFLATCVFGIPISMVISKFIMTKMSSIAQEYVLEKAGLVSFIACALVFVYTLTGAFITQRYIVKMNILANLGEKE